MKVIEYIFEKIGISLNAYQVDDKLYRPNDILEIYGDSTKAKRELGWHYDLTPYQLLDNLLNDTEAVNNV